MTRRARPSLWLCVALLAGLLTGQGALQDFVLCLGADGHVALEAAMGPGGSCDSPSGSQPASTAPDLTDANLGRHCGTCEDVALARTNAAFSEPSRLEHSAALVASTVATHRHSAPHIFSAGVDRYRDFLPRGTTSLTALRSTILLI